MKNGRFQNTRGNMEEGSLCKAQSCEFMQDPEQDLDLFYWRDG